MFARAQQVQSHSEPRKSSRRKHISSNINKMRAGDEGKAVLQYYFNFILNGISVTHSRREEFISCRSVQNAEVKTQTHTTCLHWNERFKWRDVQEEKDKTE